MSNGYTMEGHALTQTGGRSFLTQAGGLAPTVSDEIVQGWQEWKGEHQVLKLWNTSRKSATV